MSNIVTIYPGNSWIRSDAGKAWCEANGIPYMDTFQIDIDLETTGPAITAHYFVTGPDGQRVFDPDIRHLKRAMLALPLRCMPDVVEVLRADQERDEVRMRLEEHRQAVRTEIEIEERERLRAERESEQR